MELIADILLVAGALGAAIYCFVLARRLSRFNDLENGVGGAVAVLSAQVDDLTKTLQAAQHTAGASTDKLEGLTDRAEQVAKRLELLMVSMNDIPEPSSPIPPTPAAAPAPEPPMARAPEPVEPEPSGPIFRRHVQTEAGAV
ncbi:MAG: hypothetical protein AB8B82_09145 [Roseovarius sp.]